MDSTRETAETLMGQETAELTDGGTDKERK
jgi:hypothetical protein